MFENEDTVMSFRQKGIEEVSATVQNAMNAINMNIAATSHQFTALTDNVAKLNLELDGLMRPRTISINASEIQKARIELQGLENGILKLNRVSVGANINAAPSSPISSPASEKKESGFTEMLKGKKVIGKTDALSKYLGGGAKASMAATGIAFTLNTAKEILVESADASMAYEKVISKLTDLTGNAAKARALAAQIKTLSRSTLLGDDVDKNVATLIRAGVKDNLVAQQLSEISLVGHGDTEKMGALTQARAHTAKEHRLTGTTLGEFKEAGFNPLQVIGDKPEAFSFKTKQTSGQLIALMQQGRITAQMVDKAFELASAKGTAYSNRAEQESETTTAKLAQLKNNWSAITVDIGNSMKPLTSGLLDAGNGVMRYVHIGKTLPETLGSEKQEMNALVTSILRLNSGNALRVKSVDMLKAKYPELFGHINSEKIKNEELLAVLNKVNQSYNKRIATSGQKILVDDKRKELEELVALTSRVSAQIAYSEQNTGLFKDYKIRTYSDLWSMRMSGIAYRDNGVDGMRDFVKNAEAKIKGLQDNLHNEERYAQNQNFSTDLSELQNDPAKQKKLWGKDYNKNHLLLDQEVSKMNKAFFSTQGLLDGSYAKFDDSKLRKLLYPRGAQEPINGSTKKADARRMERAAEKQGAEINGGGRKSIIINLNHALIGNQEFKVSSMKEAQEISLRQQEEQLLRMLQGAASAAYG